MSIAEIPEDLIKAFRKFKLSKNIESNAFIMKVNLKEMKVELDEETDDLSLEEIAEELPTHLPRYIGYTFKFQHGDGRISYPLILIYYCPSGISASIAMVASSSIQMLSNKLDIQKVFDVQDAELITMEWIHSNLSKIGIR